MRAEHVFRLPVGREEARELVRGRLEATGWSAEDVREDALVVRRGSRWSRLFSLRVEEWPAVLELGLVEVGEGETGVIARFEVDTGLHLVGAVDRAVLEAEMALLVRHVTTGRAPDLQAAVAPLRRPLHVAAILNMTLASAVIALVGIFAGYRPLTVGALAFVVALLDGLVILSFGDLVLEGSRAMPGLKEPAPDSIEPVAAAGEGA